MKLEISEEALIKKREGKLTRNWKADKEKYQQDKERSDAKMCLKQDLFLQSGKINILNVSTEEMKVAVALIGTESAVIVSCVHSHAFIIHINPLLLPTVVV